MNVPNLLTLLRIFFVPLLVSALVQDHRSYFVGQTEFTNEFLALVIFLAAAATDLLDGYVARRWGQVTTVGTLLDPIADKLLVSAALISLVQVRVVAAWIAIVIISREFAVSGLRSIAASAGYTIRASDLGKTKMVSQVVAISLLLLSIHWPWLQTAAQVWLWTVVFFSLFSAALYFRKFWRKVDVGIKARGRRELLLAERRRVVAERRRQRALAREAEASGGVAAPNS